MVYMKKTLSTAIGVAIYTVLIITAILNYAQSNEAVNVSYTYTNSITTTTAVNTSQNIVNTTNQSIATITTTIYLSTTVTRVLIHTTTFTSFITVSVGVPFEQTITFITIVGAITILVGYFMGYKAFRTRVEEIPRTTPPRRR
ncbi:MAG: hypothetical protein LM568_02165 [Desulfurococcaceae archaeon]|nr:hypothetical protein [Desulfurococcaceae archaeon]